MTDRLAISVTHADGRVTRWGGDEPNATDIPADLTFGTSIPGGFKALQCSLLRRIDVTYPDEALFDTVRVYGPGNVTVWEGRIQQLPRSHGDSYGVTPGAVGWSAHLRDNSTFQQVYVDRDITGRWSEASLAERRRLAVGGVPQGKVQVTIANGGMSWLPPNEALPNLETTAVLYDIGAGINIARLEYRGTRTGSFASFEAATFFTSAADSFSGASTEALTLNVPLTGVTGVTATDIFTKASHGLANGTPVMLSELVGGTSLTSGTTYYVISTATNTFQLAATSGGTAVDLGSDVTSVVVTPQTIRVATSFTDHRYGMLRSRTSGAVTPPVGLEQSYDMLVAYGDHGVGLTSVTGDASGLLASDVISHVIATAAPLLSTAGIDATDFPIPHLVFADPVTAEDAISLINGYHAWDWGVWEDRTFFYTEPDPDRLTWEARLSDGARIDLEGDTAEQIFNGVVVFYSDGSGRQRTVGPPGAPTDYTDAALQDTSLENPWNAHFGTSTPRWENVRITDPTNLQGATTLGTVWLAQHSLPQRRGSLTLTSTVTHPTQGALPVCMVRAGDYIRIADHSNSVARKIIETNYTHSNQTISLTLDNTAPKLEALIERLAVGRIGRY